MKTKTCQERLGHIFGDSLDSLHSFTMLNELLIVRHWMFQVDEFHKSSKHLDTKAKSEVIKTVVHSILENWRNRDSPIFFEDTNLSLYKRVKKLADKADTESRTSKAKMDNEKIRKIVEGYQKPFWTPIATASANYQESEEMNVDVN